MTPMEKFLADMDAEPDAAGYLPMERDADTELRVRFIYGDHGQGGREWTALQRLQAVGAVRINGALIALRTEDLPEGHPLRRPLGPYPVHQHLMSMGRADVPSYHGTLKVERFGNTVSVSQDLRPERRPIVARQAEMEEAERRIFAGRATYHVDNGDPDDERGITSYRLDPQMRITHGLRSGGLDLAAGDDTTTISYWRRKWEEQAEPSRLQAAIEQGMRDSLIRGLGVTKIFLDECTPDPLAAMTCHRDAHTLEERKEPPWRAPALQTRGVRIHANGDAEFLTGPVEFRGPKPPLIVPDGCVLVIPDDVNPWEFLARYDTSQMARTALVVNRKGYQWVQKTGEQQKAERAEERRTHAALTFEQPIQNRLGRMAR